MFRNARNPLHRCAPSRSRAGKTSAVLLVGALAISAGAAPVASDDPPAETTLEETRIAMDKWIETQQIISKEQREWQQGREVLAGRLELVRKEVTALEEKIQKAQEGVAAAEKKRADMLAKSDLLEADIVVLREKATALEAELVRLLPTLPESLRTRLDLLIQRIPKDPANTKATPAERFQSVLGILNEVNKANSEIAVDYEVRTLSDGKPSEVKVLYVGLAQAYFVSSTGEAGVGSPTTEGWSWSPSKSAAGDVLTALEILQGKHSPAFVPLPMKIQ